MFPQGIVLNSHWRRLFVLLPSSMSVPPEQTKKQSTLLSPGMQSEGVGQMEGESEDLCRSRPTFSYRALKLLGIRALAHTSDTIHTFKTTGILFKSLCLTVFVAGLKHHSTQGPWALQTEHPSLTPRLGELGEFLKKHGFFLFVCFFVFSPLFPGEDGCCATDTSFRMMSFKPHDCLKFSCK